MIASARGARGTYAALASLFLGIFIAALDQTVVVTALPSIIDDLKIPFARLNEASWIVTGYLLGYTVAMPLFGRVSDVYGRRRTYVFCVLMFAVGSILCGLARDLHWLIGARVLQAAGGGAIVPIAMAIASDELPAARRSLALGAVGAVAEAGGVLGPLYGAAIVGSVSWRWIFYLNLPIGALMIASVYFFGHHSHHDHQGHHSRQEQTATDRGSVDFLGAGLIGASLGALTLGLSLEAGSDGSRIPTVLLLGAAAVLLALFIMTQRRLAHPLLDLTLFNRIDFAAGNAANFLIGIALITAMVNVPLFAATVLQRPPVEGGLMLMRLTAALPFGALIGGALCPRIGLRPTAILGLAASALGLYLTSQWTAQIDEWQMTQPLVIAGLGFGLVIAPITTSALGAAGDGRAGIASALVTVMRMVGMMVGLSALTAWGLDRFNSIMAGVPLPLPLAGEAQEALQQRALDYQNQILQATLTVFNETFIAAAATCLIAILVVGFLEKRPYHGTLYAASSLANGRAQAGEALREAQHDIND